ncbi:hypothetical protein [Streptomyces sp. SudanB66_2053]|uniref:hypothetical protein n=1 Tax=Streptomyces sp. SudanB66_2053 TaxID=3035277 RepID=UPI003F54C99E
MTPVLELDALSWSVGGAHIIDEVSLAVRELGVEPMLILGSLFVLAVYLAPGGLTALGRRRSA